MHRAEVIAHRGTPRERPENTIPSFLRALEHGADAIELDVHGTCDGVVVVHHDPVPRAASSRPELAGRPIARLSAEELATFRVAAVAGAGTGNDARWAEGRPRADDPTRAEVGTRADDAVDGIEIPTLDTVLEAIGDRATVYVEIKARAIEDAVVACIRRSRSRCAVHCFDHRVARRVKELAPELPTGVLIAAYLLDPARVLRETGARDYWLEWTFIDAELVRRVHEADGRVIAWTVNGHADAAALAGIGVDGLCSDVPGEIRSVVERAA